MDKQTPTIRIIIVDDHSKIHIALDALLMTIEDIEVVGHGRSAREAVELCDELQPDVVLMDVVMSGGSGIDATDQILAKHPHIKILALSGYQDKGSVTAMLEAGAVGYVLKTSNGEEIANIIRASQDGQTVLSREVVQTLLAPPKKVRQPKPDYQLTSRELEVLSLMITGMNNTVISESLCISISTTRFHVTNILAKLDVSNRGEAVALAVEEKLVP